MLVSSLMVCAGQLLWKLSANSGIVCLLFGFILYGLGALAMIIAYRFGEVTLLQPILGSNYIISLFLAAIVLKETIDIFRVIGVIVVFLGVIVVAGSDDSLKTSNSEGKVEE